MKNLIKKIRYGKRDMGGRKKGKRMIVEIKSVINNIENLKGKNEIEKILQKIEEIIILY